MKAREKEMPGAVGAANRADVDSSQANIVGDPAERLKALLLERAARAGITVHESFGGFVVGRGILREVPDLRVLHRCLGAMGALQ